MFKVVDERRLLAAWRLLVELAFSNFLCCNGCCPPPPPIPPLMEAEESFLFSRVVVEDEESFLRKFGFELVGKEEEELEFDEGVGLLST